METNRLALCLPAAALSVVVALGLLLNGCVERKLTVKSEPSGAEVYLDGEKIGKTPVTVDFEQYGGREITLSKKNYLRQREIVRTETPVYEWFGIDFFFEMIWPLTIVDRHEFSFRLKPLTAEEPETPMDIEQLEKRSETLQDRAESYSE